MELVWRDQIRTRRAFGRCCQALLVRQCIVDRRTNRDCLRLITLLGRGAGAVGVDLGSGFLAGIGNAGAQAQLRQRLLDNAARDHRRAGASKLSLGSHCVWIPVGRTPVHIPHPRFRPLSRQAELPLPGN